MTQLWEPLWSTTCCSSLLPVPFQTLLPPLRFTHVIFHATSLRRSLKVSLGFESPQEGTQMRIQWSPTRNLVRKKDQDGFHGDLLWSYLLADSPAQRGNICEPAARTAQSKRRANSSTTPQISQVSPTLVYMYFAFCYQLTPDQMLLVLTSLEHPIAEVSGEQSSPTWVLASRFSFCQPQEISGAPWQSTYSLTSLSRRSAQHPLQQQSLKSALP